MIFTNYFFVHPYLQVFEITFTIMFEQFLKQIPCLAKKKDFMHNLFCKQDMNMICVNQLTTTKSELL